MVIVTEKMLAEYEAERLAHLEALAKGAPRGVAFKWTPPALNEDGSVAEKPERPEADLDGPTSSRGDWRR